MDELLDFFEGPTELRVLVCGGRDYNNVEKVFKILDKLLEYKSSILIIHGAARGADTLAGNWAKERGYPVLEFPANWEKYKKRAGPIRNKQMLDEGKPDLVIAFPGGNGTANMIKLSRDAGIDVSIIEK